MSLVAVTSGDKMDQGMRDAWCRGLADTFKETVNPSISKQTSYPNANPQTESMIISIQNLWKNPKSRGYKKFIDPINGSHFCFCSDHPYLFPSQRFFLNENPRCQRVAHRVQWGRRGAWAPWKFLEAMADFLDYWVIMAVSIQWPYFGGYSISPEP